jgi:hypothetical protein
MPNLTVACVEVGNYLGKGAEYVKTLRSMCARHLPEHRFVVLSDREHPGVETIVEPALPASFWAKIELFKPGRFPGPTVYFDLDVVISDRLHGMVELLRDGPFWALDDFAWPLSKADDIRLHCETWEPETVREVLANIGGWGTVNSSVMMWRDEEGSDIYTRYTPEAAAGLAGDQNWITQKMRYRVRLIPRAWARSYRLDPPGAPITVHHGDGKPHEVGARDWY